jgi:hypothetical protein
MTSFRAMSDNTRPRLAMRRIGLPWPSRSRLSLIGLLSSPLIGSEKASSYAAMAARSSAASHSPPIKHGSRGGRR